MSLNPELEAFLELAEDGRSLNGALHEMTVEQARSIFAETSRQLRWAAPEDVQVDELRFATRDGAQRDLRLYRTRSGGTAPAPVLLYLHGGGYVVGSLDSHDGVCREFCARVACAVLAVDYRLAPEARFPTALDDAVDALGWLAKHGRELGLDSQRVVFAGDSAGATLAAVLAIQAVRPAQSQAIVPIAQLLCYPVADASRRSSSMELFSEGYLLESDTLEWFYGLYARSPEDRYDWRFSPLLTPSLEGVAPAIVALAGLDPLLDEGRAFAQRLQHEGVAVTLREYPGLTHDFMRLRGVTPIIDTVYAELAGLLQEAFERR